MAGHKSTEWAYDFLTEINCPVTMTNVQFLYDWMHMESGGGGGKFNPLNTVQPWPGATDYNTVGVKNYLTYEDGIAATRTVIAEVPYADIVAALKAGNSRVRLVNAVTHSIWGTPTIPNVTIASGVEMIIIASPHTPLLPGRTAQAIWNPLNPFQIRLENGARMQGDMPTGTPGVYIVKIIVPAGFLPIGMAPHIYKTGANAGKPDGSGVYVSDDHQDTYDFLWKT